MARRNGRGSKSLADTITQFERSELRLVRSASSAQILSTREASRLEERFSQSSSQKRSTDVLSAAIHLNKLLTSALKDGPGAGRTGSRSEYDIVTEMGAVLRAEQKSEEAVAQLLRLLGELVPFDSYHFRTTPRFETAHPAYAFLNRLVAVASGDRRAEGPIYTVHEVL